MIYIRQKARKTGLLLFYTLINALFAPFDKLRKRII